MNTYTNKEEFTEGWFWQKSAWVPPKPPSQSVQASNQVEQSTKSAAEYNKRQKKIAAEEAKKAAAAAKAEAARKAKEAAAKAIDDKINAANAAANSYATQKLSNGLQKTFAPFFASLKKAERSDNTEVSTTPKTTPLPQTIDASKYTKQTELSAQLSDIEKYFVGAFGFTKFRNDATKAYLEKCIVPSDKSYHMTLLDNNYHTFDSCKMNADLNNHKYFALVKPDEKMDQQLYQCYVSNESLPKGDYFDEVTIWRESGKTAIVDKKTGDFMVDSTNISNTYNIFNPPGATDVEVDKNEKIHYYLELLDNGNIKLHRVLKISGKNHSDKVVWQLFSDYSVIDKISMIAPLANPDWKKHGNHILEQGRSISSAENSFLTSPSGFFKLKFDNEHLVLKASVYACKSSDATYQKSILDENVRMYSAENKGGEQPYYIYQLKQSGPSANTTYYEINNGDYKLLQPIDAKNPDLKIGDKYSEYIGYYPLTTNVMDRTTTNSVDECKNTCSQKKDCTGVFTQQNDQNTIHCTRVSNTTPYFMPNQTNDSTNESTYYIREPKMDLANNTYNIPEDVSNKTQISPYTSFTIGDKISTSGYSYGMDSIPSWKELKNREYEFRMGKKPEGFNVDGYKKHEGFDTHGYYNPSQECSKVGTGCQPAIQNGQITPLIQIANDYDNQIKQMTQTYVDMSNNLDAYYATRNTLNNNNVYDFSANQVFTTEDNSLINAMQHDTKQMALQQNNLYIAGSILTTTLLITAIYLGIE